MILLVKPLILEIFEGGGRNALQGLERLELNFCDVCVCVSLVDSERGGKKSVFEVTCAWRNGFAWRFGV